MDDGIKKYKSQIIISSVSLIVIILAVLSLLYDYHKNGNCVTMIAGLWSALATLAVGVIAYWQNKRYKQLADQQNDLAFMPDLYTSSALSDVISASTSSWPSKVRGSIDGIRVIKCNPIKLWILKGPIINLKVVEIWHGQKHWACCENGELSYRDESKPFNLVLDIPAELDKKSNSFTAILQYENIYGTRYQKNIDFTIEAGSTTPDVQELKRARRIDNEQA